VETFIRLLGLVAADNGLGVKPTNDMSWPPAVDWQLIETQAKKLKAGEDEIFCTGESDEVLKLREKYSIEELHIILNAAFDGELYECFYFAPR